MGTVELKGQLERKKTQRGMKPAHSPTVQHPPMVSSCSKRKHWLNTHKEVLMALSFSKVMSASLPFLVTETSFPQKLKKS